ncbi:MAG TPA: hypothetical protein PLI95_12835, partial [Polyangiaceae bacterium]|nr:hypothetical protein [Polyangiaceae bacterium]
GGSLAVGAALGASASGGTAAESPPRLHAEAACRATISAATAAAWAMRIEGRITEGEHVTLSRDRKLTRATA